VANPGVSCWKKENVTLGFKRANKRVQGTYISSTSIQSLGKS